MDQIPEPALARLEMYWYTEVLDVLEDHLLKEECKRF